MVGPRSRLISASELRTWCYCHKAWDFERFGYPSSLSSQRVSGTKYHEARDRRLRGARRTRFVALAVMVICVVVLSLLGLRDLLLP